MKNILQSYGKLLASVDAWFGRCLAAAGSEIACRRGCSECCRGLFDITLLDARFLKSGFDLLAEDVRSSVLKKAAKHLENMRIEWPGFDQPYILNIRPEEDWEALMPEADETPCPLLSEGGDCLLYRYRPMTCRLHGLPLIEKDGTFFHDEWCTLNFAENSSPLPRHELRWNFTALFETENALFQQFTHRVFNHCINELDTFIPTSLLIDFEHFDWKQWLDTHELKTED